MLADIHILHSSDVYKVSDFKCHCNICSVNQPEYNEGFCMSFIRKGFFEYRTFRRNDDVHVGRVLLSKAGYEHVTKHIDDQPDITTVYEFKESFFKEMQTTYIKEAGWFLQNNDIHSIVLQCAAETEYLHHKVLKLISSKKAGKLQIDELVLELLNKVLQTVGNAKPLQPIAENLKKHHLITIEMAKEYILQHYKEDISLQQLAQHCCVSAFHFSRIFKTILEVSPHQYLTGIRLQHAKHLVQSTVQPVADIAFEYGFNSPEHFAVAYRQQFRISPSTHRKQSA
jgi:AraC-like DNA-binding protein